MMISEPQRISALLRRDWQAGIGQVVAEETARYRTPAGTMTLRPWQAVALREARALGGVFVLADVGAGKTLFSLLAGTAAGAHRPAVFAPGANVKDTRIAYLTLATHWRLPTNLRVVSYTEVSNYPKRSRSLQGLYGGKGPDMLIFDEAAALRRYRRDQGASAVALQFWDYLKTNPDTKVASMTATPRRKSLLDFTHLMNWALKTGSPLPQTDMDLAAWARVFDEGEQEPSNGDKSRVMVSLGCGPDMCGALKRKLQETPGVVVTLESFQDVGLTIRHRELPSPPAMAPHWEKFRLLGQRPDGVDVLANPGAPGAGEPDRVDGMGMWAVARQLALGFCYVFDPRPPEWWLERRSAWCSLERRLCQSGEYYTPGQVRDAADAGALGAGHKRLLDLWREAEASFTPVSRPLWLSSHALRWVVDWAGEGPPGVVFVDHTAFGEKLAWATGWPFFQAKGVTRGGKDITRERGDRTVIASRKACGQGKHLPMWSRALLTAIPANGLELQQNIGRLHRPGQLAAVTVDLLFGCQEHHGSWLAAEKDAQVTTETLIAQKLSEWPVEILDSYRHLP